MSLVKAVVSCGESLYILSIYIHIHSVLFGFVYCVDMDVCVHYALLFSMMATSTGLLSLLATVNSSRSFRDDESWWSILLHYAPTVELNWISSDAAAAALSVRKIDRKPSSYFTRTTKTTITHLLVPTLENSICIQLPPCHIFIHHTFILQSYSNKSKTLSNFPLYGHYLH